MEEIWKPIIGYEGIYEVSNLGNVRKNINNKIKNYTFNKTKKGYYRICLCVNGKANVKYIHQIVAQSFLNHIPNKYTLVVNHKDGIKTNNKLENLEIVTNRYNCADGYKRKKTSSEHTGVYWFKKLSKWRSQITVKNRLYFLGYYDNEVKAHEIYEEALKNVENDNFFVWKKQLITNVNKTSKYKGVFYDKKRKKWGVVYKAKILAFFDSELDAFLYLDSFKNKLVKDY